MRGPIVVLLGQFGEVIINDELYSDTQIDAELRKQLAVNVERIITIKADAKMDANQMVDFLEKIRAAGGKNLSIVTQSGLVGV
jgi:biopolymer transport protein ExbD